MVRKIPASNAHTHIHCCTVIAGAEGSEVIHTAGFSLTSCSATSTSCKVLFLFVPFYQHCQRLLSQVSAALWQNVTDKLL